MRHARVAGALMGALLLAACGPLPSERIARDLQSQDAAVRREAVRALGKDAKPGTLAASEATAPLLKALGDTDPGVRAAAAVHLGTARANPDTAVPALETALRDASPLVRMNAASALGLFGEKASRAVPALLAALNDLDPDTRRLAAAALLHHPDARYVPPPEHRTLSSTEARARLQGMGCSAEADGMFRAASSGDVAAVVLLLKAGVDPNVREDGPGRRTALMMAGASPDVLRALLAAGADVKASAPSGTALFSAATAANPHSVKVLIDAGADVNARNASGETALAFVRGSSQPEVEISTLLKKAGGVS